MAVNFYIGDSWNKVCPLKFVGKAIPGYNGTSGETGDQPDFSLWTVTVKMFDAKGDTELYTFQVTNLSNPKLPTTNGRFLVEAPSSDTASWEPGKVQIIVQVLTDGGVTVTGTPLWYRIMKNPMNN